MQQEELQHLLRGVEGLSRKIGSWMKDQVIREHMTEIKSPNNLVTYVDKESERMFVEGLQALMPQAGFVAEEGTGARRERYNWIIDPLDGTTNFVHGVPVWCTSIALADGTQPVLGVIHDPVSGETFTAALGCGAHLNGTSIRVSGVSQLSQSLLATGFPYDDFGREEPYLALFRELMRGTRGLRRLGSAALDMAWTAAGRFDAFYEYGLNPWDVAAGTILVREAGGQVSCFDGSDEPVFGDDLLCTNGHLHEALKEVIARHF